MICDRSWAGAHTLSRARAAVAKWSSSASSRGLASSLTRTSNIAKSTPGRRSARRQALCAAGSAGRKLAETSPYFDTNEVEMRSKPDSKDWWERQTFHVQQHRCIYQADRWLEGGSGASLADVRQRRGRARHARVVRGGRY